MATPTIFPTRTVIVSFKLAERMLDDILRIIPYCPEHENVWSPHLVTVLIEVGSQLDSLWNAEIVWGSALSGRKRLNIEDYFHLMGKKVGKRWLVFWGEDGEKIQPFASWDNVKDYSKKSYRALDWWQAYNEVKHDRLANRRQATLKSAICAVAGLFIAIFRCPYCAEGLAQEKWTPPPDRYGLTPDTLFADDSPIGAIVAESELLSHPLRAGYEQGPIGGPVSSEISCRFSRWCDERRIRLR